MLSQELQHKIDRLRQKYKTPDSVAYINKLESDLRDLAIKKEQLDSPAFKEFAKVATNNLDSINTLLMNDETLLNDKGLLLVQERKIWREIIRIFSIEHVDQSLENLEKIEIDEKLQD